MESDTAVNTDLNTKSVLIHSWKLSQHISSSLSNVCWKHQWPARFQEITEPLKNWKQQRKSNYTFMKVVDYWEMD